MSYSGWRGGEKYRTVGQVRASQPEKPITHPVKGLIPKNRLGRVLLTKLKVLPRQRTSSFRPATTPWPLRLRFTYRRSHRIPRNWPSKTAVARVRMATVQARSPSTAVPWKVISWSTRSA